MAMTKAEAAAMERLKTELAFRWPMEPPPLPMTKEDILASRVKLSPSDRSVFRERNAALGWCQNAHARRVDPAWSDGITHGRGNHTGDGGSQGMGQIYKTKRDAALAMRWEMCRKYAAELRAVDATYLDGDE